MGVVANSHKGLYVREQKLGQVWSRYFAGTRYGTIQSVAEGYGTAEDTVRGEEISGLDLGTAGTLIPMAVSAIQATAGLLLQLDPHPSVQCPVLEGLYQHLCVLYVG